MNLLNKCSDHFSSFIKFWSSEKKNTVITISDLYFSEERNYSEENTSDNENFCSTILQTFQFEPEQKKKRVVMRVRRKKLHTLTFSCRFVTYIRIGNLDWCKFGHSKNQSREIDCLCCREVDTMLIASTKIFERKGRISPYSFHGELPDY